jgi:hypothetical protein
MASQLGLPLCGFFRADFAPMVFCRLLMNVNRTLRPSPRAGRNMRLTMNYSDGSSVYASKYSDGKSGHRQDPAALGHFGGLRQVLKE